MRVRALGPFIVQDFAVLSRVNGWHPALSLTHTPPIPGMPSNYFHNKKTPVDFTVEQHHSPLKTSATGLTLLGKGKGCRSSGLVEHKYQIVPQRRGNKHWGTQVSMVAQQPRHRWVFGQAEDHSNCWRWRERRSTVCEAVRNGQS